MPSAEPTARRGVRRADRRAWLDYTGADCRGWMAEVGFSESYVEHLVGPDSMVVGIK